MSGAGLIGCKMFLEIKGQCPSGKNQMKIDPRSGRHYPNPRFAAWRDQAVLELRSQWNGKKPIDKPVYIKIRYFKGDLRRRDVAGIEDAICHTLEKAGVVEDDSLLGGDGRGFEFHNEIGVHNEPRVEIFLYLD